MAEAVKPHLTIPQYVADYELGLLSGDEVVTDVLAQLRHFCDLHAVDFGACDRRAYEHYLAEKSEQPEDVREWTSQGYTVIKADAEGTRKYEPEEPS